MNDHTTEPTNEQSKIDGITPYFPPDLENYAPWVANFGLIAEYGKCQCLCGNPTSTAQKDNEEWGHRAGCFLRFKHGHRSGAPGRPLETNTTKLCECGCNQPVHTAKHNNSKWGYTKGLPVRFVPGHHVRLRKYPLAQERFWAKVSRGDGVDDCWEWTAALDRRGYGVIGTNRSGINRAHRVAWEMEHGPVPDGMSVCHRCDNPRCVRVSHLFLGTHADNMRDMSQKGRAYSGVRPKGTDHSMAKLNEEQVKEIRRRAATGESKIGIAAEFGVSVSLTYAITTRKIWKHIP